jgi:hypothetical protein
MSDQKYEFTGVWIPKVVWESTDLTWMEKCLAAEIGALAAGEKYCTASNAYLAKKFDSSAASVANQICKLRRLGFVITEFETDGSRRMRPGWVRPILPLTTQLTLNDPVNAPSTKGLTPLNRAVNQREKTVSNGDIFGDSDGNPVGLKTELPPIPQNLNTEAFTEAWLDWQRLCKERRKPLKPTSANRQLQTLSAMGPARAVAAVLHSIEKNYQGIYEPTNKTNGHAKTNIRVATTCAANAGTANANRARDYR